MCDQNVSVRQVLFPLCVVTFTVFLSFALQTTQVLHDRDALHEVKGRQETPLAESQKLQDQLKSLVIGTQKLAEQGNKNAKIIADKLKEIGVVVNQNQAPEGVPMPANAAKGKPDASLPVIPPASSAN